LATIIQAAFAMASDNPLQQLQQPTVAHCLLAALESGNAAAAASLNYEDDSRALSVLGGVVGHSAEKVALAAWLIRNVGFAKSVVHLCTTARESVSGEANPMLLKAAHDVFCSGMRHVPTIMAQMQQLKQTKGLQAALTGRLYFADRKEAAVYYTADRAMPAEEVGVGPKGSLAICDKCNVLTPLVDLMTRHKGGGTKGGGTERWQFARRLGRV
jgi:hypothetical protein